jgi:acyl-CoA thioester hydrolase
MGAYLETFRSMVSPAELDHLSHMNAQYYFAAVGSGITAFQIELGLTPSDMREGRRLAFAAVHGDTNFRAELKAGDVIRLDTAVTEIGNKTATFHHRLFNVEKQALSCETHLKCVLMNLDKRRAVEIPEDVKEALRKYLI